MDSLVHGFTTRRTGTAHLQGDPLPEWLDLPDLREVRIRQVHGNRILTVRVEKDCERTHPADGAATTLRGTFLVVRTADCLPLLLVDPDRQAIGAVHAGWRGIGQGIALQAVRTLVVDFGSRPSGILVGLGPAIGLCCYRVGEEVRRTFASRDLEASRDFSRNQDGSLHLDLRSAVRRQLTQAGVPGKNIQSHSLCTACRPDLFFSRRRDGNRPERMHAFIAWKGGGGAHPTGTP